MAAPRTATIAALRQPYLPWLGGAALAGCAAVSFSAQTYVLVGLMLVFPLFDRAWRPPALSREWHHMGAWAGMLAIAMALLAWRPDYFEFALLALLLASLHEEWFFRAYFMMRIGTGWYANLITSLLFALLHGLTHDIVTAALVFAPSLFYGWLYQRTRDLPLLVLLHTLSNLVFRMFLVERVQGLL